jgi:hypothetical protein
MPEFILDHGTPEAAREYSKLDAFTQSYIGTMFWTDASSEDDGDLADATFAELSPDALKSIVEDCRDFQTSFAELLQRAYATGAYDESNAGHDFWLTRNRHGAGFWDRGLGDIGDQLTKMAHPYGEVSLLRGDDGLVHLM